MSQRSDGWPKCATKPFQAHRPKFVQCANVHALFLRDRPLTLCKRVLYPSAERLTKVYLFDCFFARSIVFFLLSGGIGLLRDPAFPAKTKSFTVRQGYIKHAYKNLGSISTKRRGHEDVCAAIVQTLRLRIVITWFQCRLR